MADLSKLCIHQVTLVESCDFRQSIECFARHGVKSTAVWREKLDAIGAAEAARILADQGVAATSLCPGGLLTSATPAGFHAALEQNRRCLEQAATINAATLVVITGGLPGPGSSLEQAREQALDGLSRLLDDARSAGVKLALEPLHPMVCGLRSVISSLREANDWLDILAADDVMRIALDSYALWWEPDLQAQIVRAGPRISNFHVSDWLAETRDVRVDRGMPGDGLIDLPALRGHLEAAGYAGEYEVEILSSRDWWRRDPDEVVEIIKQRIVTAV